jgi:hypothetical protein
MENVGCVTFTERYIYRESPTEARRASRADTILHELAHQWFGNLVSPVWWYLLVTIYIKLIKGRTLAQRIVCNIYGSFELGKSYTIWGCFLARI